MSKSIKKAKTAKAIKFTAIVGGKEISIKSSCKKFGKPVMNAVKEHVGTCKKCSDKNSDIFKVCKAVFIKNTPVAKKKTTSNNARDYFSVVKNLMDGQTVKTISAELEKNGMKKTSAKSFVSSCNCVLNALAGKSRKKDGIVNLYCNFLKNGEKGDTPKGDTNSIGYCKKVYSEFIKINSDKKEIEA